MLVLTADYPPATWSGIGGAVESQACALAGLGVDVTVLVGGAFSDAESAAGVPGLTVRSLSAEYCPVDTGTFDLVHLHSLALSEFALELCRRTGLPLVYTAHSLLHLELEDGAATRFWLGVQDCVLAASDHVIFLSAAERWAALDRMPELAGRSSVLPNSVPPLPRVPPQSHVNGPVVFAGRFTRNKGIDLLAEIVPLMLAARSCHFVLAGGHGDSEGERIVRTLAERFPNNCLVAGWLPRQALDQLFAHAALVLVLSLYEPFGMVALEAMRLGAPVLAAATGGLMETVADGSGGRLEYSRDPRQWSVAALEIISDPRLTEELSARGPRYVASRFDAASITRTLVGEVYEACQPVRS